MIIKSHNFDDKFIYENLMGPNSVKIVAELTESLKLEKGMKVL